MTSRSRSKSSGMDVNTKSIICSQLQYQNNELKSEISQESQSRSEKKSNNIHVVNIKSNDSNCLLRKVLWTTKEI